MWSDVSFWFVTWPAAVTGIPAAAAPAPAPFPPLAGQDGAGAVPGFALPALLMHLHVFQEEQHPL